MQNSSTTEPVLPILDDLRKLLIHGVNATQETICNALEAQGHHVNQSKVSRLLRKINAIKFMNDQGEMVYHLPHDATPPPIDTTLSMLIIDIVANETTIIIRTSPGSASLIARIIDHKKCQILGTIAGDDTIFVAPQSIKNLEETIVSIKDFLGMGRTHK